ncbi:MAG TPA: hypothetical protein VJI46_07580 [Candidatus Nanoarchaeia archaeon]|nr:hypothetical protein [Candidatus Nanoarchaeia archaeon]
MAIGMSTRIGWNMEIRGASGELRKFLKDIGSGKANEVLRAIGEADKGISALMDVQSRENQESILALEALGTAVKGKYANFFRANPQAHERLKILVSNLERGASDLQIRLNKLKVAVESLRT